MSPKKSRKKSRIKSLHPLAGLLATGLAVPSLAQSVPYPTYVTGPLANGSWVVSSGQVITPAGTQVGLGIRVRAKAIALNPNPHSHTAAVLTLGTSTGMATEPSRCSTPGLAMSCRTTSPSERIPAAAIAA